MREDFKVGLSLPVKSDRTHRRSPNPDLTSVIPWPICNKPDERLIYMAPHGRSNAIQESSERMAKASSDAAVIVGGGQAGAQCAISLRQHGWSGAIVMIAAEDSPPYQRPPLSKACLAGEITADRLLLRPRDFYEAQDIRLRLGESVTTIDLSLEPWMRSTALPDSTPWVQ